MGLLQKSLIKKSKDYISTIDNTIKKLSEINLLLLKEEEKIDEEIKEKQITKDQLIKQNEKNLKIIEKIEQIIK